jgi:hypothetical protein
MDLSKLEQQVYKTLLASEAKYSKQIQKTLLDALTSIYGEMTKIYKRYAINQVMQGVKHGWTRKWKKER